jgi:magnesium-transporting ATPase (P-type)
VGVLVKCILYSEVFLTLTEVSPCFFLGCKANARVKLAKTRHGPHSSKLVVICVVLLLFVLFYALFVCKCVMYYCHPVTTQQIYHIIISVFFYYPYKIYKYNVWANL